MNARKGLFAAIFSAILLSMLIPVSPGTGTGADLMAQGGEEAVTGTEADQMLKEMPETMPKDYTDEEINRMLDDVQEVDDSQDVEGKEEAEAPAVTDEDRALVEDIRENPEKYAEYIKDREWLDDHPVVVWSICSDYVWINAHPQFAARIYVNYDFWSRYPYIAYVIVCNRPFLVMYPRVSLVVYGYDGWFIQYPYIACEVYRNYAIFNRYPDLFHRYYRHREWMHRHPRVMKVACGNRDLLKSHIGYLDTVYRYRRVAIRNRHIPTRHMAKIHTRWQSDPRRSKNFKASAPNREWKQRPDQQRGKKINRGDARDRGTAPGNRTGGKSGKNIKRGGQYNPDREYRRGMAPSGDRKSAGGKNSGRISGKSEKLIKRGEQYRPDRDYRRGMTPSGDKKIISGGEKSRGSSRQGGPDKRGGGSQQGGGEKHR